MEELNWDKTTKRTSSAEDASCASPCQEALGEGSFRRKSSGAIMLLFMAQGHERECRKCPR